MKTRTVPIDPDENGAYPVCPYCESPLRTVRDYRSPYRFLSNIHLLCCPECNKLLNASLVSK
ncbi:MAG TPA: hypothetical protein PK544_15550 [Spirochaetota bacterium]|nr:hypothetical protein [Spirochaetota bacterium]HPJ39135.1 hypothetical protein [Spirochaetota bacterium]HPQ54399.1 hypothetical protein [Spirochaetota bacterium]